MVKINLKINCICFFSDFVITTPLQQSTMWSIPKMYGLNSKLSDNGKLETRSSNNVLSAMSINLALLLLHKQLSNISGLEDTELCLQKRFTVQKGKFLQILHWPKSLCPCYKCNRVGHGQWSFYLWLSYFNYTTETVIKQICQIKKYEDPQLRLVTSSVQQLSNHVDCVIVSICDSLSYWRCIGQYCRK